MEGLGGDARGADAGVTQAELLAASEDSSRAVIQQACKRTITVNVFSTDSFISSEPTCSIV